MTNDQESLVGSYADNCWNKTLISFFNNKDELRRLNKHRGTNWTQKMLNEVIVKAFKVRNNLS